MTHEASCAKNNKKIFIKKYLWKICTTHKCHFSSENKTLLPLNKNDNYYFLEINPVGQYGMVADPCNYELDKLIAKYLINGKIKTN